jgi:PAS domain S-box-containing protein
MPMHIDNIPVNNLYVEASGGQLSAQSVTIIPLIFNEQVYGVFELIFLARPEKKFRDLLERVSKNLAAMLQSIQNNDETKKLLELSLKQTEELRAAEEEMRQNVEELAATQEALQRQQDEIEEQRLKSDEIRILVQSVIDGYEALIFAKDELGKLILLNDAFALFIGNSKNAVLNKKTDTFFSEILQKELHHAEKKAFLGEKIQRFEAESEHNKTLKTFDITVFPIKNAANLVYAVCFIMRDISERAILEKELKESVRKSQEQEKKLAENFRQINEAQQVLVKSENKFRGLIKAIDNSSVMIEADAEGNIKTANSNAQNLFGTEKIVGKNIFALLSENFNNENQTLAFKNAVFSAGKQEKDFKIAADEKEKWANLIFTPLSNGTDFLVLGNDITAEKHNQIQAEKLSLVADNTGNSVTITDANGLIEYVNKSFTELTEYTFEEVKGKKPGDFLQGKETNPDTKKLIRQKLNEKVPFSVEILNYSKSGQRYWIALSVNPITDTSGKVLRFVAIQSDITLTKVKSLEYECRLNTVDKTNAVIEFDLNGYIISANELFLQTMGYTLPEILGKHHAIFIEENERKSADYAAFWKNSKNISVTGTFKRIDKFGKTVWLKGAYNTIVDAYGEPYRVIKVAQDVSEQKTQEMLVYQSNEELLSTEEELRQNLEEVTAIREEMERQIAENEKISAELNARMSVLDLTAILSESDLYGTITYINERFTQVTGYEKNEIVGKPHKILRHPDNPKSLFKEMWETIKSGKIFRATYPNLTKNGAVYWVDATIAPVINEKGQIIKYIGIRFEVTDLILKEQENKLLLEKSSQNLEELRATEEEIRQNMEELIATQEELNRTSNNLDGQINAINRTLATAEFDTEGTILNVNDIFLSVMGYTKNELIGKKHSLFVHSQYALSDEYKHFWNDLKNGKAQTGQIKRVNKKGDEVWFSGTYTPVFDNNGKVLKIIKLVNDITAQMKQDLELRSVNDSLSDILPVFELSPTREILAANDTLLDMLGFGIEEIRGRKSKAIFGETFEKSEDLKNNFQKLQQGNALKMTLTLKGKNGNPFSTVALLAPVRDSGGALIKIKFLCLS